MDGRPALWKQLMPLPAKQEPWPGAHGQGVRPRGWADPGRAADLGAHGLMQAALFWSGGVRGAGQEWGGGGSLPRPPAPADCTQLKAGETPSPQVGGSGDRVADEAGPQERVATSVFRVMRRSVYFSPKCEGVFIVFSWVTASGTATWMGGVFSRSASLEQSPGRRLSGTSPSGHRCALCAETERHPEFRRECRWELLLEGRQRPWSPQTVSSGHVPGGPVAETVPSCRGPSF